MNGGKTGVSEIELIQRIQRDTNCLLEQVALHIKIPGSNGAEECAVGFEIETVRIGSVKR